MNNNLPVLDDYHNHKLILKMLLENQKLCPTYPMLEGDRIYFILCRVIKIETYFSSIRKECMGQNLDR